MFLAIKEVTTESEQFSVNFLCDLLKINRSSYYKWLNKKVSNREKENEVVKIEILKCHVDLEGIYGYRRMTASINLSLGTNYNEKRIHRLMREELNIASVIRRKKKKSTPKKTNHEYQAENILNREFYAERPQQKVLTDITEFKYGNDKKLYLCACFDLFDKSILSYSLSDKANTELVLKTLKGSFTIKDGKDKLLHSDRGAQFTSKEYQRELKKLGVTHSMSRVGKCIDNGPMEGFFGIIKTEKFYLKNYTELEELKTDVSDYIKFYNEKRIQKNLGNRSPLEYRKFKEINVDN